MGVCTGVLEHVESIVLDGAVGSTPDGDGLALGSALHHGQQVLGSGLGPAHRSPQFDGRPGHQQLLEVEVALGPEAPADIGIHHPHGRGFQAEHLGQQVSGGVGALGAGVEGEAVAVPRGGRHSSFDGSRGQPLIVDRRRDHHGGVDGVEGGPLAGDANDDIGSRLGVEQGGVGQCVGRVDHRGPRLVVDQNQFGGVGCSGRGVGDHHGDRFTHEANRVSGEHGLHQRGFVDGDRRRQVAVAHIGGGEHGHHAGGLGRGGGVDAGDGGVGQIGADVGRVERTGEWLIGDEHAPPPDEGVVLTSEYGVAENG